MLKKRLAPRPTLKPKLTTRRPPQAYVDLLTKPEKDFQQYVQELENDPAFRDLVKEGIITTMRFGQRIPRHKYQEYMDRKLFQFLEESGITQHEGWADDLLSPTATQRTRELAEKYNVPVGEMSRYLRYLASTSRDDLLSRRPAMSRPSTEPAYDPLDDASSEPEIDLSDIIDITRRFVETYHLTEQEFFEQVLCGDMSAEELAETHGCSLAEAEEVLEAADRIQIAESYESPRTRAPSHSVSTQRPVEVIARVEVTQDQQLTTQFANDSMYIYRYRIDPEVLMNRKTAQKLTQKHREILASARYVNQRLSTLSRLIAAVCKHQERYLQTGDPVELRPLSQADLSRMLGEHQSTVCRVIRDRWVDTPLGRLPLTFFCQSKTDVVARLVNKYPDLPDNKVQEILAREYGCRIARRTVAYHRGKRLRRQFRKPKKQQAAQAPGPARPTAEATGTGAKAARTPAKARTSGTKRKPGRKTPVRKKRAPLRKTRTASTKTKARAPKKTTPKKKATTRSAAPSRTKARAKAKATRR